MRPGWTPRPRALLLFLLSQLTLPGDGNEGSVFGSCPCDKKILSAPRPELMDHIRKYLKAYNHCPSYVRFHLHSQKVCGGSKEPWVQELMSCLDRKECGSAHKKRLTDQKHLPPTSTPIPEPTEAASPDKSTLAQTQHTQQSTLPPGPLPLDNQFTLLCETTTPTSTYSLGARPEAVGNHKQQEEKGAATAGTSAVVPVLSLLAIAFILTGVLLFVLCKRRKQSKEYSSDLQLQYTLVTPNSNTPEPRMEA